ncbi:hypothetical protein AB6A40_001890 [Gnathostoma spinigerum]|uniref:Uncharacterized protein n=1 Tax=Gnathostoma spinigerum TaxID=75299 RepID=A0ABD6E7N8_9BILA
MDDSRETADREEPSTSQLQSVSELRGRTSDSGLEISTSNCAVVKRKRRMLPDTFYPNLVSLTDDSGTVEKISHLIDGYCRLYFSRFENSRIGVTVLFSIVFDLALGGLRSKLYEYLSSLPRNKYCELLLYIRYFGLLNTYCAADPSTILLKCSALEASLSITYWGLHFLKPHSWRITCEGDCEEDRCTFGRTRFIYATIKYRLGLLREAVLCEDWSEVGRLIGSFPAMREDCLPKVSYQHFQTQLKFNTRYYFRVFNPFMVSIFHTGLQRLMAKYSSKKEMAGRAAHYVIDFIKAEPRPMYRRILFSSMAMLYCVDLLVFLIANEFFDIAVDILVLIDSLPRFARTKLFSQAFRSYKALLMYEKWRRIDDEALCGNELQLADELILAIENGVPWDESVLVFVDAAIEFFVQQCSISQLFRVLVERCQRSPCLTPHCYRVLNNNGLTTMADELLSTVELSLADVNPTDPCWLDWVEPRLLKPTDYDTPPEMLNRICGILFNFLDFGENRANERAWALLWASVEHTDDTSLLKFHWSSRQSWWPKFHTVPMSASACRIRTQILNRLSSLDC